MIIAVCAEVKQQITINVPVGKGINTCNVEMPWKTKHSSNVPGPLFFKFLNETSLPVIAQCKVSEETCQMRLKCLRYIHIKFLKIQTSNIAVGE